VVEQLMARLGRDNLEEVFALLSLESVTSRNEAPYEAMSRLLLDYLFRGKLPGDAATQVKRSEDRWLVTPPLRAELSAPQGVLVGTLEGLVLGLNVAVAAGALDLGLQ